MKLQIKRLTSTATLPRYMTDGAAGMDLYADGLLAIGPGDWGQVKTGLQISIPDGFEGQVRTRSGAARDHGVVVLNSPGTIDSDYRGEIVVLLANYGSRTYYVHPDDRIAQLVIAPVARVELVEVEALDETTRGAGGFGSTGDK